MSRKYKFLQPTYIDKFKCSGSDCNLDCCSYNWTIYVDKETYQKYKKVKIKSLSEKMKKFIKKNKDSKNDLDFSILEIKKLNAFLDYTKLNENKEEETSIGIFSIAKCPFHTEDKLCSIQKDLGFDYLSNTCKIFPRVCNKIGDNYEKSLQSGCEEVSKLLYNEKDGIKFEIGESDTTMKNVNILFFDKQEELALFDNIRAMCISILQLPEYNIENKIILLSVFMFKISDLLDENMFKKEKYDTIYNFIEEFSNNISQYDKLFEINKVRNDIFLNIFIKELSNIGNFNGDFNLIKDLQTIVQKLKNCYTKEGQTKLLTLQIKDGEKHTFEDIPAVKRNPLKVLEDGSIISSKYLKYKKNTEKLMKGKEYYIENILINSFFVNRYPSNGGSVKDNCIKFVISYCFYKGLLTSFLGEEKTLNEALLHRICSIWGRKYADEIKNLESVVNLFKEKQFELNSLSNLIVLIKSC